MGMSNVWTIRPFEGVGKVRIGTTKAELRLLLNEAPRNWKHDSGPGEIDFFVEHGVHAHYNSEFILEGIELSLPRGTSPKDIVFTFDNILLLERPTVDVVADMVGLGHIGIKDKVGYKYADVGLALYAPGREEEGDIVEGVAIYGSKSDVVPEL